MQSSNVMFNCFECNARIALASSRISQGFLDWETRYLGLSTPLYSADTFPNFHITIQYVLLGLEGKGKFFYQQQSSNFQSFVIETLLYITIHLLALLRNNASKKETRHLLSLATGSSKALKVVLARLDGETLAIQSSRLELFKQVHNV